MRPFKRALLFNQMAGPLFLEQAEGIAKALGDPSELYTGHPDTLKRGSSTTKLNIIATPAYDRSSIKKRALSWLSYALFCLKRCLRAQPDELIIFCSNPPILTFVGALLLCFKRLSISTIVHDIYPDTITRLTRVKETSPIAQVWRALNRFFYNQNLTIITLSPGMAKTLNSQFSSKATVIYPWADSEFIKPIEKTKNPLAHELGQIDKTTVLYSGNLGISHDIDSMLKAALLLKDQKDVNFLFIGEGAKWQHAKNFQSEHNLETVQVLPFQPVEKLPFSMALADIALVAMEKEAEGLMIPSKTFHYLAAGAAVIGLCSPYSDLATIINEAGCGITTPAKNPERLAKNILQMHINRSRQIKLKHSARRAALTRFSKNAAIEKTISTLYNSIAYTKRTQPAI